MRIFHPSIVTLILGIFFLGSTALAVEVVIEAEAPKKSVQKAAQTTAVPQSQKQEPVSIDALVARYENASEEEAYKIMNLIKQEIARMSRQRQEHAIGKVRREVKKKSTLSPKQKRVSPKKHLEKKPAKKKQPRQQKQSKKRYKKHISGAKKSSAKKSSAKKSERTRKADRSRQRDHRHPDPLSVMGGMSDSKGATGSIGTMGSGAGSPGGGMGDFSGGMGGMGGMGSGGTGGF